MRIYPIKPRKQCSRLNQGSNFLHIKMSLLKGNMGKKETAIKHTEFQIKSIDSLAKLINYYHFEETQRA